MIRPYYQKDSIRIYHGDCREILPELRDRVDLVLTDPPYKISTKSDGVRKVGSWADLVNGSHFYESWLGMCRNRLSLQGGAVWSFLNWRSLITFQRAACLLDWPIESLLVWDKANLGPGMRGLRPSYEMVALWVSGEYKIPDRSVYDVKRVPWAGRKPHGHQAEKPIELVRWLAEISGGEMILDPVMGSGTTLEAAHQLGRPATGIELEESWCEVAARRLDQGVLALPKGRKRPRKR